MIISVIMDILQIVLFAIGCYYFVVAMGSFKSTCDKQKYNSSDTHTYALLVAAHNEENVIGELVKSLKGLDYPKDKYEIFVIADNCTDKTAQAAKGSGAVVWERENKSLRGKGYALEFAFERLFDLEESFEYFCIFDADNLVKPDFLKKINAKINDGYQAVQGYLDSKNPNDNWLTFSYSLWYWMNNRLSQLARENLALGCRLGGTGFAVAANLIKRYGWGATCLAEDTEFTLKLALNDIKVGWAHQAVVYDEKPTQLGTSMHQRKRWMQGLSEVAVEYVKPLAKKGLKEGSTSAINMLMNFWGDTLYPLTVIFFWSVYLMSVFLKSDGPFAMLICGFWDTPFKMVLLSMFVWGNLGIILAGLHSDQKLDKNIMKNSLGFLIYIASWIPIAVLGFLKRNEKEWFHTPHSRKNN
jgi:cellulose synthase/poly-beta-1,6-N-acetylglucosamine synthase-like glycosyltransferase